MYVKKYYLFKWTWFVSRHLEPFNKRKLEGVSFKILAEKSVLTFFPDEDITITHKTVVPYFTEPIHKKVTRGPKLGVDRRMVGKELAIFQLGHIFITLVMTDAIFLKAW